jgi:hypothetical protein
MHDDAPVPIGVDGVLVHSLFVSRWVIRLPLVLYVVLAGGGGDGAGARQSQTRGDLLPDWWKPTVQPLPGEIS